MYLQYPISFVVYSYNSRILWPGCRNIWRWFFPWITATALLCHVCSMSIIAFSTKIRYYCHLIQISLLPCALHKLRAVLGTSRTSFVPRYRGIFTNVSAFHWALMYILSCYHSVAYPSMTQYTYVGNLPPVLGANSSMLSTTVPHRQAALLRA